MIEKLTKKQEAKFKEYIEKYTKLGLSTKRINKKKAGKVINKIRTEILNLKEAPIVFADSPLSAWIIVNLFKNSENSVENSVRNSVRNSVENSVRNSVENSVWNSVWKLNSISFVWPYVDGHWMVSYFSFYDFMQKELGINLTEKYNLYRETIEFDLIYPFEDITIVTEKPTIIKTNKEGILHCDDSPALEYADGFKLWRLNGIEVPEWLITTPIEKMDCKKLLEEKNADVRREIIRKIGITRIEKVLGSSLIEEKNGYQLITLNLGDDRKRPYLKMVNPSIETIHIEGVHPSCDTVEKALCFRNGLNKWVEPVSLT